MSKNSQETESGPEQEDKKFIREFQTISQEHILRPYEEKNRDRISDASWMVKGTFDDRWKKVMGDSYFQPQTTIPAPTPSFGKSNVERSDPRSRRYRSKVVFSIVRWRKIRRKISKRFRDLFILDGTVKETNLDRPIFQNLSVTRVKELLGEENTEKILVDAKKNDHGEITGTFTLDVEGYWELQFAPKTSKNDTVDVILHWEGQTLVMQRMEPIVLPGFYIEAADHTTKAHYVQNPEQGRKKIGDIQQYPYTILREATREEYLAQKQSGDKIMRESRAKQDGI